MEMVQYGTPGQISRLCRFINGKCDVTDDNEIAFLVRAGYAHDPIDYGDKIEQESGAVAPIDPATVKTRRRKANASE